MVFCKYLFYLVLQVVFVEIDGLINQEWSRAAGQACKIIVSDRHFTIVPLSAISWMDSAMPLNIWNYFSQIFYGCEYFINHFPDTLLLCL